MKLRSADRTGMSSLSERRSVVFGLEGLQPEGAVPEATIEASLGYVRAFAAREPGLLAGVSLDSSCEPSHLIRHLPDGIAIVPQCGVETANPVVFHVLSLLANRSARSLWPLWARSPSVALAVSAHDDLTRQALETQTKDKSGRLRASRHRLVTVADVVVATSQASALDVVGWAGIDPCRVFVAHQPAGPDRHDASDGDAGPPRGIFPDGFDPGEGFVLAAASASSSMHNEVLVQAFASVDPALRSAWRLVIASSLDQGPGMDRLKALISTLGVDSSVTVLTGLGDRGMRDLYRTCRIAVIGGVVDGSIGAALDAASAGAGIVVADHDALMELVAQPDARYYPTSVDSTRSVLLRCLTDGEFCRARRSETADALAGYAESDTAASLLSAYRRALEARARRALPAAAASL